MDGRMNDGEGTDERETCPRRVERKGKGRLGLDPELFAPGRPSGSKCLPGWCFVSSLGWSVHSEAREGKLHVRSDVHLVVGGEGLIS